tara:strand:+ start:415 stop:669 length:255 start_codon:yes stop_codon:yes gene_type:complete
VRLWIISRIAEDFHCLPHVAERLLLDDPEDTAIRIMELRNYAAAFRSYQAADGDIKKLEATETMDLVIDNVFRLKQESFAEGDD